MTAYTVLRFTKLKSWGAVGGAGSHNARLRQTLNADPEALQKNRFLVGSPGDDLTTLCQARLNGQKIRRNAVYAVEGVMSARPAYFRPDSPEQYGQYTPARLEVWVDASMGWLQNKYGDRVTARKTTRRRSGIWPRFSATRKPPPAWLNIWLEP